MADQPKIFISYARPDQTAAEQVEQALSDAGFEVFRDTSDIRHGSNWDMMIEQALRETDRMVLLLSSSSMPYRKEVHREWFYYDQEKKPLHPLYLEKCDLHSRIYSYNYLDAREDLARTIKKLIEELRKPFEPVPELRPPDKVMVVDTAEKRTIEQALDSLMAVARGEEGSVALHPDQVEALIKYKPKNLNQYRAKCIAEWSQTRYQLDNRFVQLTLMLDQGEEAQTRWENSRKFTDLWDVLDEVKEPSIVLLGAPGSGKSTLLRRLQLDEAFKRLQEGGEQVTFFIQLNQYKAPSLDESLPSP